MTNRPLRVFLCHSSNDKPAVRELYQKLRAESWIQPWLDEEELYPGQDWNMEIEKAVEAADAIIVCLTKNSINKEGYVQRELRIVLDFADYKPEGTIYILPVRLEECEPPRRLRPWQYADYFEGQRERGLSRLLVSLKRRADSLGLRIEMSAPNGEKHVEERKSIVGALVVKKELKPKPFAEKKPVLETPKPAQVVTPIVATTTSNKLTLSNGMEFMRVPTGIFLMGAQDDNRFAFDDKQYTVDIPYDYWMARFPVTNEQYSIYIKSKGIEHPVSGWEKKKDHPVISMKWTDAMEYCQWLNNLLKGELPSGLVLRLPTEAEWEKAARGTDGREFPWGNKFDKNKCNTSQSGKGTTTAVDYYSPRGDSPYSCADMAGNVWEWTHSEYKKYPYNAKDGREDKKASGCRVVLRGGSFVPRAGWNARCAFRNYYDISGYSHDIGFRVVLAQEFLE